MYGCHEVHTAIAGLFTLLTTHRSKTASYRECTQYVLQNSGMYVPFSVGRGTENDIMKSFK